MHFRIKMAILSLPEDYGYVVLTGKLLSAVIRIHIIWWMRIRIHGPKGMWSDPDQHHWLSLTFSSYFLDLTCFSVEYILFVTLFDRNLIVIVYYQLIIQHITFFFTFSYIYRSIRYQYHITFQIPSFSGVIYSYPNTCFFTFQQICGWTHVVLLRSGSHLYDHVEGDPGWTGEEEVWGCLPRYVQQG